MPHHIHHHHEQHARAAEPDVATVESVVYVTASPTFEGPVVGYTTPGSEPATQAGAQQAQQAAGGAPQFFNAGASSASVAPAPAAAATSQQAQNALPAAASNQPSAAGAAVSSQQTQVASGAAATTLVSSAASSQNQPNPTMPSSTQLNIVKGNSLSTSVPGGQNAGTTAAPTAAPEDSSHHGMSSGAQAGLAIGILALVGILVGVAYIFYRRRATSQAEKHKKLDDEKNGFNEKTGFDQMQPGLVPRVSIRKHGGEAPRLSMRPTTEMFDNGAAMSERKGAANGGFATAAVAGARGNSQEERKSEEPVNPFGDHATTAPVEAPKPLNISRPSTPNGQAPQSPSTSPGVAAGSAPPGGPGPMNVHRVQLDFAPSMEDELELRAGQLVRMLHEYDDGWALCIRLDRSQQGVVPRSCISKLPVKPRPHNAPPSPNPGSRRGPPPPGSRTRPAPGQLPRMRSATGGPAGNPFDDQSRARSNSFGAPGVGGNGRSPPGNSPLGNESSH